jgi:hypothetical protein
MWYPQLPGTINNLVHTDVDDNISSGSPRPPPPPSEDDVDPMPPQSQSLPEQVDEFGWTLSAAIRDFRSHIEEVFGDHYQQMKRAEDMHRLSLAKLAAENAQLRERLGLGCGAHLLQNISFQSTVANTKNDLDTKKGKCAETSLLAEHQGQGIAAKQNTKKNKGETSGKLVKGDAKIAGQGGHVVEDLSRALGTRRRNQVINDPMAGGGNWETFVAWVPAGAALQCPQPWKPLPNEAFAPVTEESKAGASSVSTDELDENTLDKWQVLDVWEADKDELDELRKDRLSYMPVVPKSGHENRGSITLESTKSSLSSTSLQRTTSTEHARFIIHPHSRGRIAWDVMSLLMVLYDMVMIPMALFFDVNDGTFIDIMVWATRSFWTFDMGMSCCTAIVMPDGTIMHEWRYIVWRYLRMWFMLDLFIVGSDWLEFIISLTSGGSSDVDVSRITRIFRIVRIVRLLRLVRIQSVMQSLVERIQSDNLFFLLNVVKLALALVSFAHITACVWWGIGKRDGSDTWSQQLLKDDVDVETRYLVSLHWTLSQFSGGMEEVRPAAPIERFFVILIWIVAFMGAAIMGSILTASLVQAQIIGSSQASQLATLRKYLNQNYISKNVSLRVQRSAKHAVSGDLSPDTVDLLGVVSESLKVEMHFEMYGDLLLSHPFLEQCIQVCKEAIRRVCHQATSTLLLDAGDVLFSKGEQPAEPKMYFVFKGTLEYTPNSFGVSVHDFKTVGAGTKNNADEILLTERHWIAEPVLWLRWVHRGQLKAITDSKVAIVDARKFHDIMERFKEVFPPGFNPKLYAHEYAHQLNSMAPDQVNDTTGLHTP